MRDRLRHHLHLLPVAVTVLGIALFSVMDALMKRASLSGGVYPVLLARSVIGAAAIAPVWLAGGCDWPRREVLQLHVMRGVLVAGMAATFFWGIVRMPLAKGIALSFIAPLLALWLAAVLLGERIRRQAIVGALLGLCGVVVIAVARIDDSPRGGEHGWAIVAILVSATFYAWNLILQRQQAQVASPLEVAFFQNAVVALLLAPAIPWLWQMPSPAALAEAATAAALASASLMLIAWAYARAEAQTLVPIEYTAFLWAALMGWWWFDEAVTAATLGGVVLILGGVWIASRNGTGERTGRVPTRQDDA